MKLLLSIIFISLLSIGFSQTEEHPIDTRNSTCHDIDSNQTTLGMKRCEFIALEEWTIEMNKYYNLLLDTLSIETSTHLQNAQEAWIIYNEKEKQFSSTMYYSDMQGTMWHVVNAGRIKNIVRERAIELKDYYETFIFD